MHIIFIYRTMFMCMKYISTRLWIYWDSWGEC